VAGVALSLDLSLLRHMHTPYNEQGGPTHWQQASCRAPHPCIQGPRIRVIWLCSWTPHPTPPPPPTQTTPSHHPEQSSLLGCVCGQPVRVRPPCNPKKTKKNLHRTPHPTHHKQPLPLTCHIIVGLLYPQMLPPLSWPPSSSGGKPGVGSCQHRHRQLPAASANCEHQHTRGRTEQLLTTTVTLMPSMLVDT
jgi:hypothetical protein